MSRGVEAEGKGEADSSLSQEPSAGLDSQDPGDHDLS